MIKISLIAFLLTILCSVHALAQNEPEIPEKTGVLLLAHGGNPSWNAEVTKVAAEIGKTNPVEIAFGMASKRTIDPAVKALIARGVSEMVAVPLFISSHSSVITSTEFLLGKRQEAPSALALFAKMDHGGGDSHSHGSHTVSDPAFDPLTPVRSSVPIRMVSALDGHPLVADILLARAAAISKRAENEVLILVAHGPNSDETNKLWLGEMRRLADIVAAKSSFKRIEYLTVRDDAPEPIRSQATAELRNLVKRAADEQNTALVVPLLLSYGGIEEGIKKRLEGLTYTMSPTALLPDERIVQWVRESIKKPR